MACTIFRRLSRKILFDNNFMRCLKCTDRHLWATLKYTVVLNMLSRNYMYIFCSNDPGAIINQKKTGNLQVYYVCFRAWHLF